MRTINRECLCSPNEKRDKKISVIKLIRFKKESSPSPKTNKQKEDRTCQYQE